MNISDKFLSSGCGGWPNSWPATEETETTEMANIEMATTKQFRPTNERAPSNNVGKQESI